MLLYLLEFIHFSCEAVSLYAGFAALSRIFSGRPFEHLTIACLQSALIASVIGMLFPEEGLPSIRLAAMITVYIAGVAVLAWRRFHLTRTWGLIFALSLIGVLCLEALVFVQSLFRWLSPFDPKDMQPEGGLCLITESVTSALFLVMGVFTVRMYRSKSS